MSIFEDAIAAVRENAEDIMYDARLGRPRYVADMLFKALLAEYCKRLEAEPPPVIEAHQWRDTYGCSSVIFRAVSPPDAFPDFPGGSKKKQFWLIEMPEKKGE